MAGIDPEPELLAGLASEIADHAVRVLAEQDCRRAARGGRRCRCSRCRGWSTAPTWAASTSWPTDLADQGVGR